MDDLRFYVLFNSFSVILERCLDDNERLCAMEFCLTLRKFRLEWRANSVRYISRPALNPLSYRGSYNAVMLKKPPNGMANSEDYDQTALKQSDLDLHSLLRPVCINILNFYGS